MVPVGLRTVLPRLLPAALLMVGVAWIGSVSAVRPGCPPVELIAHRGLGAAGRENTIAAFEQARQRGFAVVESDVRFSADGAFVLVHDRTLQRTAARPERVSQLSVGKLGQVRTHRGHRIPTLAEALGWARLRGMSLLLHIKHDRSAQWSDTRLARLDRLVARSGMAEKVTYLSYEKSYLRAIERLDHTRRTAWIPRTRPTVRAAAHAADKIFVSASTADERFVARMHRAGVQVGGLPTQSEDELHALARAGVVEVITDDLRPRSVRTTHRTARACVVPRGGWR